MLIIIDPGYIIAMYSFQFCFTSLLMQGHCVAVLMALLELMTPKHYQILRLSLMNSTDNETDLGVRHRLV